MNTSTLYSVFVFMVVISMVGGFLGMTGFDNGDAPAPPSSDAGVGEWFSFAGSFIPSPTGVIWFDLLFYGGLTMVLAVGAIKLLPTT